MTDRSHANDHGERYARSKRRYGLAWAALLLMLAASAALAQLHLGAWNLVVGLAIAVLKTAVVVWLFMALRDASPQIRLALAAGAAALLVLFALGFVDFLTRRNETTSWQVPQWIPPKLEQTHPPHSVPKERKSDHA